MNHKSTSSVRRATRSIWQIGFAMSGGSDKQAPATPGDPFAPPGVDTGLPASEANAARPPIVDGERRRTPGCHRRRVDQHPVVPVRAPAGKSVLPTRQPVVPPPRPRRRRAVLPRRRRRGAVLRCAGTAGLSQPRPVARAGVDIPSYRSTTFQISATPPSPGLDGTLTVDETSRAFRFVGTPTIHQTSRRSSPDGARCFVQEATGSWRGRRDRRRRRNSSPGASRTSWPSTARRRDRQPDAQRIRRAGRQGGRGHRGRTRSTDTSCRSTSPAYSAANRSSGRRSSKEVVPGVTGLARREPHHVGRTVTG